MSAAALSMMLFGVVTAFGVAPDTVVYEGERIDVVDRIAAPAIELLDPETDVLAREIRIRRGDTVSSLLAEVNVQDDAARSFLHSSREADAMFRQLAPGKTLTALVAGDGSLHGLRFPLNGEQGANLEIQRTASGFEAGVREPASESQIRMQSAVIRHSLFGAADEVGIPDAVAIQLAEIFGGDIDFHRDLRQGDRFSVIYEAASHQGGPVRSLRILAAEFVNDGNIYHAFWHQDADGRGGYYAADGRSVRKAFLRSPLEFSRISSGFSSARLHPILGRMRAHRGIDYAAPTGTKVRTTGDGVIDFVGNKGGYGKVVIVRHPGNRTTLYAHLSRFAAGLRKGMRVSQGDAIGHVGATGMATGPHLHYEFRVAGVHRNPLAMTLPSAPPLDRAQLPQFRANAEDMLAKIAVIRDVRFVMLD
jgi:murein DD-endopeptidase MepM/ murein hydrolase activator NlpD